MQNLIFLDTETTGLNDPRLVQLAYSTETEKVNKLFKPPKPIEIGAMAVAHITNEMVEEKEPFKLAQEWSTLKELVSDGIVVAHNAPFDLRVLEAEGITCPRFIDTRKCAMHLFDYDGTYSLQQLRYAMGIYKNIDNSKTLAHDAMGDVIVLNALFVLLCEIVELGESLLKNSPLGLNEIVNFLEDLTKNPLFLKKVKFGKYGPSGSHAPVDKKFYSWEDVTKMNKDYVQWLHNSESTKPEAERDADLLFTLKECLENV